MSANEWNRVLRNVMGPLAVAVLAACGGGGGGDSVGGTGDDPSLGAGISTGSGPDDVESVPASGLDEWRSPYESASAVFPTTQAPGYLQATGWSLALPSPAEKSYTAQFTGRGWYVDAKDGSDANPGTLAKPWRTLQRAESAVLASGDALLLKCGQVWRGQLTLIHRFAPKGNVLIGGYGDCTQGRRPVIRASDWIDPAGWRQSGSGASAVYVRSHAQPVKRLFLNGEPMMKARFPNHGGVGKEFAAVRAMGERNRFKVAAADLPRLAAQSIVGADIHVRVAAWQVDSAVVAAFDPASGLVTLDRNLTQAIADDAGYIMEGKRWMLDAPGEWWFDATGKQLYLWGGDSAWPAKLGGLEAAWRERGLDVRWINAGLRVERLRFDQQDSVGLALTETNGVQVSDVESVHAGDMGISVLSSSHAVVQQSVVRGAGKVGLNVRSGSGTQVRHNMVSDTGMYGRAAITDSAISVLQHPNALVEGNTILRSSHLGIRFGNLPGVVIRGNTVLTSCIRLSDCAGIYTFTASYPTAPEASHVARGVVENNIIVGAKSNLDGVGKRGDNQASGIYLDELSSGIRISGNTISGTEVGIAIHNGSFNQVTGNTVRGVSHASFRGSVTRTDQNVMRSNQVRGNSFEAHVGMSMPTGGEPAETDVVVAQLWYHPVNARGFFTGSHPNVVSDNANWSLLGDEGVRWRFSGGSTGALVKAAEWKSFAPTDSNLSSLKIKPYLLHTEGASLVRNGSFAGSELGLWSTYFSPSGGGGSFSAVTSSAACGGAATCGRFVSGAAADYLASTPFEMNAAAGQNLYVLRYGVKAGVGGGNPRLLIRRNGPPYDNYGGSVASEVLPAGQSRQIERIFRATGGTAAVLSFSGQVGGETFLSNVSLHRVHSVEFPVKSSLSAHAINTQANAVGFSCAMLGLASCDALDDKGQAVVWPLIVQPRSSVTVFARDPKWMDS